MFSSCSRLSLILAYFSVVLFQELEKSLKATCEEFIMSITKLVVDPMLSFVTKVAISSLVQTLLYNLGVLLCTLIAIYSSCHLNPCYALCIISRQSMKAWKIVTCAGKSKL